jgi:hypothetical protein
MAALRLPAPLVLCLVWVDGGSTPTQFLRPSEVNTSGATRASQRPAAAAGAGWDSAARAGHAGASGGVDPARCHAPQGAGARAGAASSWLSCIRRPVRTMPPAGETVGYGHQEPGRYWAARAHDADGIRVNADSEAADGFQERAGTGRRRESRRATASSRRLTSALARFWPRCGPRGSVKTPMLSRATVEHLWQAGLADARRSTHHPDWCQATEHHDGMRVFDFTR